MPTITQFLSGFTVNGKSVLSQGQVNPQARTQAAAQSSLDREFLEGQKRVLQSQMVALQEQEMRGGPGSVQARQALGERQAQLEEIERRLAGTPVSSSNATLRKYGLTDADFQYDIAPIYGRLLQTAEQGGGYLSPTQSSREFAGATAGAASALDAADRGAAAAAAQSNLNPLFASRASESRDFDAMSRLFGERSKIAAEGEARRFNAMKAFADLVAGTTVAQQQERTQTIAALTATERGLRMQDKASQRAFWGNAIGGVSGAAIGAA